VLCHVAATTAERRTTMQAPLGVAWD